jgi:hypothetical protein
LTDSTHGCDPEESTGLNIAGTSFAVARIGSFGGRIAATRVLAPSSNEKPVVVVVQLPSPPAPGVPIPYPG